MNIPDIITSYKNLYPSLIDIFADDFAAFLDGKQMRLSRSVTLLSEIYNPMSTREVNRANVELALECLEAV